MAGWEEAGPAPAAWRITRDEVAIERPAAFFPDQKGGVYEQLLFSMPVMIQAMDATGRISAVNHRWSNVMGYSQAEVAGMHFNDLLAPASRAKLVQKIYPHYFQTDHCREEALTLKRKDGGSLDVLVSMTAYRGAKGRIERSICVLEELETGVASASQTLSDPLQFRTAFEASTQGMALLSASGEVICANPALRQFLGHADREAPLGPFDELFHGDDRARFLAAMTRLLTGEVAALKEELRFQTKSGKLAHGAIGVSIARNADSTIDHFVVEVEDLSGRKLAEQQLRQTQRMEAIGQLTGGLAHDFNNLLTVVIGNLQLIDLALKDHPKAHKRALEAIEAAQKGSGLTKQLLAFARQQALEPQQVNINDLVRTMTPLVLRTIGESTRLSVELMPGAPKTVIDPSQLESAILNLAINARDAMGTGDGQLTIETQPAFLDEDYAAANADVSAGPYVMVAVSDTGNGIAPDVLQKVFQPFFTTKPAGHGSGLGLSQVYGFIKQSGGHIQVYSEIDHGTSIKMYLPRIYAPGEEVEVASGIERAIEPPALPSEPVPAIPRIKILVVEDQEAVRQVACSFLTDFGYAVIEAENGADALGKLRGHPDIRLMFSDVVMPGGMNGFELAQAAYAIRPDLKVVHTSGYPRGAMVHQEESRFREGFIIMKPYRREDLQNILVEALERQQ